MGFMVSFLAGFFMLSSLFTGRMPGREQQRPGALKPDRLHQPRCSDSEATVAYWRLTLIVQAGQLALLFLIHHPTPSLVYPRHTRPPPPTLAEHGLPLREQLMPVTIRGHPLT